MSYIEFMEKLTHLNKEASEFLLKIIREKNLSLTSMELLLLLKLLKEPISTPKQIAEKGSGLFSHLKFLLQSLERKGFVDIKAKSINRYDDANISVKSKANDVMKNISDIKIPKNVNDNLSSLEIYICGLK